ncbi:hypothetical protein FQR65_LT03696 [Abscondita terminalis]|nr:hypothetical protein FQR65_LT03696 [Abscondita terminalis]
MTKKKKKSEEKKLEPCKQAKKCVCGEPKLPKGVFRKEWDFLGEVEVPCDKYYGCQTVRSIMHFNIGEECDRMPFSIIRAYGIIKKAAAIINEDFGLKPRVVEAIIQACDEIISGKLYKDHFPLQIWATPTQTNMNVNEVISNRSIQLMGGDIGSKDPVHPNDDVNRGQSSGDTFVTAMHVAVVQDLNSKLFPNILYFHDTMSNKAEEFHDIIKIGRTGMQDAVPITLGQEFSGYVQQIKFGMTRISDTLPRLYMLPIGGTAVGTTLNAGKCFGPRCCQKIAEFTELPFIVAPNLFEALAADDWLVELSGALNCFATSYLKIANDIRLLCSGPRSGLAEISIPQNEPGSSSMGGKVNPTQCDSACMICAQVMGAHVSVTVGGSFANLEFNISKPMMVANVLRSINLLADSTKAFTEFCVSGIKPNLEVIADHLDRSLMISTALNSRLGFDKVSAMVVIAKRENISVKDAGIILGLYTEKQYDEWIDLKKMVRPWDKERKV